MIKKILDSLAIKVDGKYISCPKVVSEFHGVHRNAIYQNRKKGNKRDQFDKVFRYEKTIEMLTDGIKGTNITGNKDQIISSLSGLMDGDLLYDVFIVKKEESNE